MRKKAVVIKKNHLFYIDAETVESKSGRKFMSLLSAILKYGNERSPGHHRSHSGSSFHAPQDIQDAANNLKKRHIPSIKDFEIIKPISRGAYGFVQYFLLILQKNNIQSTCLSTVTVSLQFIQKKKKKKKKIILKIFI